MAYQLSPRYVKSTHKPDGKKSRKLRPAASEASATVTDRPDFNADDIMLGSGLRTLSIAASAERFGSYEYRVINFTLARDIPPGEHTFTYASPGPVHALSYVEYAVIGGNEVYYNCEGLTGTLNIEITGSTYTLTTFSFTARDSDGDELTVAGNLAVSSTLCECECECE